ncbi:hypothetical protein [Vibrio hyugaensis]|uniref:hypothetical protein n=1 Tax=Vibrio hyugaensis TaxID=1534743 RepID=UPI0012E026A6|nr:hypothetical protein [Vibrio hyugaensis]
MKTKIKEFISPLQCLFHSPLSSTHYSLLITHLPDYQIPPSTTVIRQTYLIMANCPQVCGG